MDELMSAVPPGSGRWVTPPPANDGSAVWSSDEYSASIEAMNRAGIPGDYSEYADFAAYSDYGGYARGANAVYAPSYTYYSNTGYSDPAVASAEFPPYWPPPGGREAPIDGYAIAAFIFGVLGVFPLGIGFGIAALRRIALRGRRGRGLAIAGLGLSAMWTVAVVIAVLIPLYLSLNGASRNSSGVITHKGSISALDLRIDDCVQLPSKLGPLATVTVIPCSQPHNGQVYTTIQATEADYPGVTPLEQQGFAACDAALPGFLGTAASSLQVVALVPNQVSWASGDRVQTCVAVNRAQKFTGDIRLHA
jgi:hypothetical protein